MSSVSAWGYGQLWILVEKKVKIKSGDALITTEDLNIDKPKIK